MSAQQQQSIVFTEVFKEAVRTASAVSNPNSEDYFQRGGESLQTTYSQRFSGSETSLESSSSLSSTNTQSSASSDDDSKWAVELYEFLDNVVWFETKKSDAIKELNKKLQTHLEAKVFADFESEWNQYSPGYPLFSLIVRQLNFHAFSTFADSDYLPFTPSNLRKELLKTDADGRNIYHWFVSGLKDKNDLNEGFSENDLALLKAINRLLQNENKQELIAKRSEFLKTEPQPAEMLLEIHEVKQSDFFQVIQEGLCYE